MVDTLSLTCAFLQASLDYDYRAAIHKALPKLKYLDDEPFLFDLVNGVRVLKISPSQQQNVNLREKLKSDWELVTERIKAFDSEEQSAGKLASPCNEKSYFKMN